MPDISEQNEFLVCTEGEKNIIRKELGLTEKGLQEDIDAILDWFYKQPHLAEAGIDRDFIERMLVISKGSREKTKTRIDNYYKYRALAPDLIQNREKYVSCCNREPYTFFRQAMMPRLYNGKRITVTKFADPDPSIFFSEDVFRSSLLLTDIRLKQDYALGEIWVVDLKHTGIAQLVRMNPVVMQKTANIFHEGLGLKVFEIHLLNANSMLAPTLSFMKQFIKQKILDRVIIHKTVEELHNYVPKDYLPEEYGGHLPNMDEFKEKYLRMLQRKDIKQLLIESSKWISNEKLRPDSDINDNYLAGSFKKLEFD